MKKCKICGAEATYYHDICNKCHDKSRTSVIISYFKKLAPWYNSKSVRQRWVLRIIAIALSAFPIFGWLFVAPWLIPLMLYLEYNVKGAKGGKNFDNSFLKVELNPTPANPVDNQKASTQEVSSHRDGAEELMKWADLMEQGHISEEEFNKIKGKILKSM
jgi:hypothetical protein